MQRRRVMALGASLSLGPTLGWANTTQDAVLKAFTENLPPLNYAEGREAKGFSTELLRMMGQQAGIPITIEVLPWVRAMQQVQERPDAILFSLTRTPEREAQFKWVGPISPRRIVLFKLAARQDLGVPNLQRLAGAKIGVVRESAAARQMQNDGLDPGQELELALDDTNNLRKLLAGRMEYMAMLDWAAAWQLQQMDLPYATLQAVLDYDVDKSYWFGLNPRSDDNLVRRLQAALDNLRRDGRYERLRQRYFR
jgi:polar amino acid transport system substrate-binding protein